jgi:hypothetical protein
MKPSTICNSIRSAVALSKRDSHSSKIFDSDSQSKSSFNRDQKPAIDETQIWV